MAYLGFTRCGNRDFSGPHSGSYAISYGSIWGLPQKCFWSWEPGSVQPGMFYVRNSPMQDRFVFRVWNFEIRARQNLVDIFLCMICILYKGAWVSHRMLLHIKIETEMQLKWDGNSACMRLLIEWVHPIKVTTVGHSLSVSVTDGYWAHPSCVAHRLGLQQAYLFVEVWGYFMSPCGQFSRGFGHFFRFFVRENVVYDFGCFRPFTDHFGRPSSISSPFWTRNTRVELAHQIYYNIECSWNTSQVVGIMISRAMFPVLHASHKLHPSSITMQAMLCTISRLKAAWHSIGSSSVRFTTFWCV